MKISIILISTVVVIMTIATIMVGSKNFDGTVVENPYEAGLEWDRAQKQKNALGWTVAVGKKVYPVGRNDVRIFVRDRSGRMVPHAAVNVKVTRPATTRYDRICKAAQQKNGEFLASLELPLHGNWDLVISVQNGADKSDFIMPVFAENK